jgi:hypothetical protein
MQDGQIKLRIRLQQSLRRTQSQHRNLREIYAELDRALDSREEREVGFWIERLCDAREKSAKSVSGSSASAMRFSPTSLSNRRCSSRHWCN